MEAFINFLCYILLTGFSQETITVNVNNVFWFEAESKKTSAGKERLTTIHFQDKAVRVLETMEEIRDKIHRCKSEGKK